MGSQILILLVSFALTAIVSGCGCGNGEGYAGRCGAPGSTASRPDIPGTGTGPTTGAGLTVSTYYWIDPAYQCFDAASGHNIASYRNAIEVSGMTATSQGDRCGNGKSTLDIYSSLTFSLRGEYVGYQTGIYTASSAAPDPTAAGTVVTKVFCRSPGAALSSGREVFITGSIAAPGPTATVVRYDGSAFPPASQLAVTSGVEGASQAYRATGFALLVDTAATAADPNVHAATLSYGADSGLSLQCRVVP